MNIMDFWKDIQFDVDWMLLMWAMGALFAGAIWLLIKLFKGIAFVGRYVIMGISFVGSCVASAFQWLWRKACE